ncbi:protein THYLAKOID ASSEMBLY 8, chloroplastic-like [Nicotiana sylvestris]|uniref:Pentatricopeptide repeat-containing protein At1g62350-like n=1 Tax=Nicotiana sylvestris TaxID=4096 RepID=A0A1U7VN40_NICSY|nr:PREDICTED: pentatricopeptide repeat-containing protein At1g62350-like [Nicotiana sylvestris]
MSSWSQCARFTAYPLDTGNNGRRLQSNTVFSSIASRTRSKCRNMRISMRDRSKNRKPLQKGRNLSIEAIQAVQALKRAKQNGESALEQVFNSKITRLLKNDLIAVLRELIRQNQCLLALKVFEEVQTEISYRPQLKLYAEMVSCLGSNGFLEEIKYLIMALKMDSSLPPDIEGFYALLESLLKFNLSSLALEVFYLMKLRGCDPDKLTFKLLINGLESNEETDLSAFVRQEAEKYYGHSLNFLDETEDDVPSLNQMY